MQWLFKTSEEHGKDDNPILSLYQLDQVISGRLKAGDCGNQHHLLSTILTPNEMRAAVIALHQNDSTYKMTTANIVPRSIIDRF